MVIYVKLFSRISDLMHISMTTVSVYDADNMLGLVPGLFIVNNKGLV